MYNLYITDKDEKEVLAWLIENIGPLGMTTKAEYDYYEQFYASDGSWCMRTTDVSDVSGSRFDVITLVEFEANEDAILCKITWGGSIGEIT